MNTPFERLCGTQLIESRNETTSYTGVILCFSVIIESAQDGERERMEREGGERV